MKKFYLYFLVLIVSSTCFFFSTNFFNIWPLLWFAPLPLVLYAFFHNYKSSSLLAFLSYLIGEMSVYPYFPLFGSRIVLSLVIDAFLFSLFLMITKYCFHKSKKWWILFLFPLLLTCNEYFTSILSPAGTGDSIAYSQSSFVNALQISSMTGIYGIIFLVFLFSTGIAFSIYFFIKKEKKSAFVCLFVVLLIEVINLAYGYIRIHSYLPERSLRVAAIASDRLYKFAFDKTKSDLVFLPYAQEIEKIASQGINYVILPEKIAVITNENEKKYIELFSALAKKYNIYIVMGVRRYYAKNENYNSAWTFSPEGKLINIYDKHHLIPIFEKHIPSGANRPEITAGTKFFSFNEFNNTISIAICKDMDFQDIALHYGKQNTKIMFVPALDFIYDGWVHGRIGIMRGVEGGFSIVRVPLQGIITITDQFGQILKEKITSTTEDFTTLIADVPMGNGTTIFARVGNLFVWICFFFAFIILFLSLREVRTGKKN